MALMHLVYLSSLVDISLESEIPKILESSVRNNPVSGITGMLLYCDGNFIQVLEGETDAVLEVFDRICADCRHRDIFEVMREPIAEREFAQWSMGYNHIKEGVLRKFPNYVPFFNCRRDDPTFAINSSTAMELLRQFALENH
ncbi:MAG: BLUF domain-containing protein [Candidatus Methylumidiphilus sp.]